MLVITVNDTMWIANCCFLVCKFRDVRDHYLLSSASGSEYGGNVRPVHIFERKCRKLMSLRLLESILPAALYKLKCAHSHIDL